MSRVLLDVNVLLALLDSDHVHHELAHEWLPSILDDGWASCPITQNGFVRIITQPRYPSPIAANHATELLTQAVSTPWHEFWACDISLLDPGAIDPSRLHRPRHVTDAYLLALATAHGGRFATFDRSVVLSAVPGATAAHLVVL